MRRSAAERPSRRAERRSVIIGEYLTFKRTRPFSSDGNFPDQSPTIK